MGAHQRVQRWSTLGLRPKERLDYWVGAVCECFLEMDADTSRREGFDAELVSAPLHGLRINQVRGSGQDVFRTPKAIARSRENYYYLLCKEGTPCTVEQVGLRGSRLLPGDLALIDSRAPYELHFPESVDTWSVQLPIGWLDSWLPDAQHHLGRRIDGNRELGLALRELVRGLGEQAGSGAPLLSEAILADQLGALLAMNLPSLPGTSADDDGAAPARRIDSMISQRCTEPGLTAAAVARELGVSVRSLHRTLSGSRQTFADRLLLHRLQVARRMLESRVFDHLAIGEIGRRVGLLDPSHFTRLCRRALGATPGELRERRSHPPG